jgi:hypothetical protein
MPEFIVTLERLSRARAFVRVNAATEVGARTKARMMADDAQELEWHVVDESGLVVHETEPAIEKGGTREAEEQPNGA